MRLTIMGHGGLPLLAKLGFDTTPDRHAIPSGIIDDPAQGQSEGIVMAGIDPNILSMFFFSLFNGLMITYGTDWLNVPDHYVRQAACACWAVITQRRSSKGLRRFS